MAMTTVGLRDSNKSLPADIQAAFEPQTYYQGLARLNGNAGVVQSSRNWGGLGGLCIDDEGQAFQCDEDPSGDLTGYTGSGTPDYLQWDPTWAAPPAGSRVVPPTAGGGVDVAAIARIIQAGASSLVPIIAATSQGVLYKVDPKTGQMTVYSQPAGSNVNLPIGGGGPSGTINTPLGSGSFAGLDSNTLLMVALVGAVALFAFKK